MITLVAQVWDEIDAGIHVAILIGYGDCYCVGGDLADGWMVKGRQGQ
jgi:enoyl-CoA hydratase